MFLSTELVYSVQPEGPACRLCSSLENWFTVYKLKVEPVVFVIVYENWFTVYDLKVEHVVFVLV